MNRFRKNARLRRILSATKSEESRLNLERLFIEHKLNSIEASKKVILTEADNIFARMVETGRLKLATIAIVDSVKILNERANELNKDALQVKVRISGIERLIKENERIILLEMSKQEYLEASERIASRRNFDLSIG